MKREAHKAFVLCAAKEFLNIALNGEYIADDTVCYICDAVPKYNKRIKIESFGEKRFPVCSGCRYSFSQQLKNRYVGEYKGFSDAPELFVAQWLAKRLTHVYKYAGQ